VFAKETMRKLRDATTATHPTETNKQTSALQDIKVNLAYEQDDL